MIVDIVRFYELQSWIRWNCGVQIDDRAMLPNDSTTDEGKIARERLPDDLSTGVDGVRDAEAVALQGSEIADLAVFPACRIERRIVLRVCAPDCFSRIVEPDGDEKTGS